MITIPGIYAAAKVYTDVIEPSAEAVSYTHLTLPTN